MARLLKGAPVAQAILEGLPARTEWLAQRAITPTLAIVRVGARHDDIAYERAAEKRCSKVGIQVRHFNLPDSCSQSQLLSVVENVNQDDSIHGCLLLRPLPKTLDEQVVCDTLTVSKDVDGITAGSLYGVFAERDYGFAPCTPEAVMELLKFYGIELDGSLAAMVGTSLVVGRPLAMMLHAAGATVTMCDTHTPDVAAVCRNADLICVAAGHAGLIGASSASQGQTVVDIGINWDEAAGRVVGDAAFDDVEPIVSAITPVPGGVGSITTACLAKHVIEAAERIQK